MDEMLKNERRKAHAKMRDEIRIAVKGEMLNGGITRQQISDAVADEVRREVAKAMGGKAGTLKNTVRELFREEIEKVAGKGAITATVTAMLKAEAAKLAEDFVNKTVVIKAIDQPETW